MKKKVWLEIKHCKYLKLELKCIYLSHIGGIYTIKTKDKTMQI